MELKKISTGNRISKKAMDAECLDVDEVDDEGLIDGDVNLGVPIATFNFGKTSDPADSVATDRKPIAAEPASHIPAAVNQTENARLRGATPPVDGEYFTLKRGYQLRPSTLRKLNELKAKHPDVNVYLNTILDAAIRHYYDYIINENGQF